MRRETFLLVLCLAPLATTALQRSDAIRRVQNKLSSRDRRSSFFLELYGGSEKDRPCGDSKCCSGTNKKDCKDADSSGCACECCAGSAGDGLDTCKKVDKKTCSHSHNPHSHNPHSHNPHSHNPHSHSPHSHDSSGSTSNPFEDRTILGGQEDTVASWASWGDTSSNAQTIANQPWTQWLTGDGDSAKMDYVFEQSASDSDSVAVFVLYYVQTADSSTYAAWITTIAKYATENFSGNLVYILEPDAIALEIDGGTSYSSTINDAISSLGCSASGNTWCYLDVGNYNWHYYDVDKIVSTVTGMSNYASLRGVSTDVSNYVPVRYELLFAQDLIAAIEAADSSVDFHAVIDTSRGGTDVALTYTSVSCNMANAGAGPIPVAITSEGSDYDDFADFVDAFLYVKTPGVGDGDDSGCSSGSSDWCCVEGTMWYDSDGSEGCEDASNFCGDMASMLSTNAEFSPSLDIPSADDGKCGCYDKVAGWALSDDYCTVNKTQCESCSCTEGKTCIWYDDCR